MERLVLEAPNGQLRQLDQISRRQRLHLTLQSWASIAPLIACILGPLSILLGIPALSQRWRGYVVGNQVLYTLPDPALNIILASLSLACEVMANALLMLRFSSIAIKFTTGMSLALWCAKVSICLGNYVQFIIVHPQPKDLEENWTYLEGFWIGCASMVISGIVILFLILNLAITPARQDQGIHEKAIMEQHRLAHRGFMFRVLILVVAMGLGALAFSKLESLSFVTALYFVTASILTVGFGDVPVTSTAGKVILFPYLVFSITYVALLVTSIAGLIDERLDAQRQLREHLQQVTKMTSDQQGSQLKHALEASHLLMLPMTPDGVTQWNRDRDDPHDSLTDSSQSVPKAKITISPKADLVIDTEHLPMRRTLTLQEEISLQAGSVARLEHRRQIRNIFLALLFFSLFWFIGAIVFAYSEDWAYGTSLYFCYVFFMTVGYGDYSPKSQLGRVLFIVYAMIAVPTVTFLVQVFVEAADVSKYVYNSKSSRQRRIEELDTRELDEIKKSITQETQANQLIGLRRTRSIAPTNGRITARTRTLSRAGTTEADGSYTILQTIKYENSVIQEQKKVQVTMERERSDVAAGEATSQDEACGWSDNPSTPDQQAIADQLLESEISSRTRLLQSARKLDHLTRLLISPHLHHEARLLLSLEMGRLEGHYKVLLRKLSMSQTSDGMSGQANREWMENTKEAEWLGLTGLERERKFVMEYRKCFAELLSNVEELVADVTPISSLSVDQPTSMESPGSPRNLDGFVSQMTAQSVPPPNSNSALGITWANTK